MIQHIYPSYLRTTGTMNSSRIPKVLTSVRNEQETICTPTFFLTNFNSSLWLPTGLLLLRILDLQCSLTLSRKMVAFSITTWWVKHNRSKNNLTSGRVRQTLKIMKNSCTNNRRTVQHLITIVMTRSSRNLQRCTHYNCRNKRTSSRWTCSKLRCKAAAIVNSRNKIESLIQI